MTRSPNPFLVVLGVSVCLLAACEDGPLGTPSESSAPPAQDPPTNPNPPVGQAILIESGDAVASAIDIAMDGQGNAIAIWLQDDGGYDSVWANRLAAGAWGAACLIETQPGDAAGPRLSMNEDGEAVAVWSQKTGSRTDLRAARYRVGIGWEASQLVETNDAANAGSQQVRIDEVGTAIAVWVQHDGTYLSIWANACGADSGWQTPAMIESGNAGDTGLPRLGIDGYGNGFATWSYFDGGSHSVWSNRLVAGAWQTAQPVETLNSGVFSPELAVAADGTAIVIAYSNLGPGMRITSHRYDGTVWCAPQEIRTGPQDLLPLLPTHQLAIDGNGNAFAAWMERRSGALECLWISRYEPAAGWSSAEQVDTLLPIDTGSAWGASSPKLSMDGSGHAFLSWHHYGWTTHEYRVRRYWQGSGWQPAFALDTPAPASMGFAFAARSGVRVVAAGITVGPPTLPDAPPASAWANRFDLP